MVGYRQCGLKDFELNFQKINPPGIDIFVLIYAIDKLALLNWKTIFLIAKQ